MNEFRFPISLQTYTIQNLLNAFILSPTLAITNRFTRLLPVAYL